MSAIVAALLLGFFGSAHCVVMCGGVAGALSGGLVRIGRAPRPVRATLAYNVGRVSAYVALGALVGAIGYSVDRIPFIGSARIVLRLAAGLLLVGAGLYVAGAWKRFAIVERAGAPLWRRVRPIASRLLGAESVGAKLGVGALWGLMPCGLVYAAFALAIASGTIAGGATVMLAFGAGTLPAMIATGIASGRAMSAYASRAWLRRAAGAFVVVFGVIDVASASLSLTEPAPVCACHRR
jgi:hypothetical protein